MDFRPQLVVLLLAFASAAAAQVEPDATGPGHPLPAGNLNYSVRYSQTAEFGGGLGDWQTSAVSGDVGYTNGSQRRPFSLQYGGGYNWILTGPSYGTGFFHRLMISQGLDLHRWNISLNDNVSYSPESPTIGFSGIPGVGEPVTGPAPTQPSDQSILSLTTHVVDNDSSANISRPLNHALSLNLGGSYDLFRFPNGDGLDTTSAAGNGGVTWRLDSRNSLTSDYRYSQYSYPGLDFSFTSDTLFVGFNRNWSRKLTTSISAGPQWTMSSMSSIVPDSLGYAANASLNYQFTYSTASASYSHGISGGAGYLTGGEEDTASGNYSRQFGKQFTLGFTGSYFRTAGLVDNGTTAGKVGAVEATRRLGRYLVVFANYSAMDQSTTSSLPGSVLGQFINVAGFGFGYSPRQERLAH